MNAPSAGKVTLTMFWDYQKVLLVLLAHFQKLGENVNYASCEVLLKLLDEIHRKPPGQLPRGGNASS
jgi:hypothetical protein